MKALILAAGFGTRLLPYSAHTPKPLFPIDGRALLDIMICNLEQAGCQAIMINTHHLAKEIELFLAGQSYSIPIETRYEPEILGTGGALKNTADFFDEDPFIVVNSDIVTNIDFKRLYRFHIGHPYPATLALCDNDQFNTVSVSREGFITNFQHHKAVPKNTRQLTFTGIQVLDPGVLDLIPSHGFSSSIDTYRKLMALGEKIKAFMPGDFFWQDIGTVDQYRRVNLERLTARALSGASPLQASGRHTGALSDLKPDRDQTTIELKGDGSDRRWYRITRPKNSLILADHGLRRQKATAEVDSFIDIGRHLHLRGLPIPEILAFDRFSGLVLMEDLGGTHLQDLVNAMVDKNNAHPLYKTIIDTLVTLSVNGARRFNPEWTCQSACYDRDLILEKECRYFTDAFLNNYLNFDIHFDELIAEFSQLADETVLYSCNGFMHRDLQSRNIMIKNGHPFFIDYQGGRTGPIQYDLASLLIDPYVALPLSLQTHLLDYGMRCYRSAVACSREKFMTGYQYCRITRNLQMLGAFAFLSQVKHKSDFEAYIPGAVRTLAQSLTEIGETTFPRLSGLLPEIQNRLTRTNVKLQHTNPAQKETHK